MDTSYLLAFGRNGFVLLAGSSWIEARPRLKVLWEQTGRPEDASWDLVEGVVHEAWIKSSASFARARLKAQSRWRMDAAMISARIGPATASGAGLH